MKKKKFGSILKYLVLAVAFVLVYLAIKEFLGKIGVVEYNAPVSPVEVIEAEERTVSKTLTISGNVEAADTVLVVPYVDGTILSFPYNEGDWVEKGTVLAQIDPEPYQLQLAQAKAQYEAYESSFGRVSSLYEKNAASRQDYDSLKAQHDAAEAQLELAELQLSYTQVTAKESGTVQKKIFSQGSAASKGTPIATIADLSNLVVNVKVGEQYFDLFRDTDSLSVQVVRPASNYSAEARASATIDFVSPSIDPRSKNFQLQVRLEENLESFAPGMYVKVEVTYGEENGPALPETVRKLDGSAYYVEDGKACYADFSGVFSDGSWFIVPEGYERKEFIIRGQEGLLPGEPVNVIGGLN